MYGNTTSRLNYTMDYDIEVINDIRALDLLPTMIVLGILIIVGIPGNSLVCYIFICRLQSGTQNFLIVCLAVLDLISCTVAIPNDIYDLRFHFYFHSVVACKIMRFTNTFCSIGSIVTLLVIAIDRYRKICKPFSGQLSMKHVRLSLIPIFGITILYSWPALVIYGLKTTETGIPGLKGQHCAVTDHIDGTLYPLLYNCILTLSFIIVAITLTVIYTFVLRETKRHKNYIRKKSDCSSSPSGQCVSRDSSSNNEISHGNTSSSSDMTANKTSQLERSANSITEKTNELFSKKTKFENVSRLVDEAKEGNSTQTITDTTNPQKMPPHKSEISTKVTDVKDWPQSSQQFNIPTFKNSSNLSQASRLSTSMKNRTKDVRTVNFKDNVSISHQQSAQRRKETKNKATIIAFLVTLVFILSFLPHLTVQVVVMLNKGLEEGLQGQCSLVIFNIFLRSYFINSVSNPFIYGALNAHFKREVKLVARKLCIHL